MHIPYQPLAAVQTAHPPTKNSVKTAQSNTGSFQEALQAATTKEPLKLSKHAEMRMKERQIHMSEEQWIRVTEKVQEAKAKGISQPLVLTNDAALVVSAQNETVVTVLSEREATDKIFTNIDGTIVLKP
ncbi:TIGR02530 family flagellar biosynthesis protein [Geomicrobium sp. JCM 19039]|uniref:TIGR02530 family flagellar biosynthesis protein n=1 Tax=Geomicrobium sp. JCM 19039 TaxID=1460636 RepID=UPI00045F143B|nr:TIGR02530 family flagellar biosynthesis protein [Geomicrobium sp. JCM 19039]GAK10927.1 hypothetical protein JCM19039_586 [Geomicrobium sp. JCM 19039]